MQRAITTVAVGLLMAASLHAGDVATLVNLGFSDDSRYFVFSQYGLRERKPYAELFIVDVNGNRFVADGITRVNGTNPVSPGQDGSSALFTAYAQSLGRIQQHRIDHLAQGRLIYLLVNGSAPKAQLDFRDFEADHRYSIELIQRRRSDSAAFHIELRIDFADGGTRNYTIGLPDFYRDNVNAYQINQVLLSPDERAIVFVIGKLMDGDIRYMVETARIR